MTTFAEEHQRRVKALEEKAKAAGTNMTEVCRNTEIARATYERWLRRAPQSVTKLDALEAEIARFAAEAKAPPPPPAAPPTEPPASSTDSEF